MSRDREARPGCGRKHGAWRKIETDQITDIGQARAETLAKLWRDSRNALKLKGDGGTNYEQSKQEWSTGFAFEFSPMP